MGKRKRKIRLKKSVKNFLKFNIFMFALLIFGMCFCYYYFYSMELIPDNNLNSDYYLYSDLGFVGVFSDNDFDNDGVDDITDIIYGEKEYASFNPFYKSEYYANGYPPVEKEGVCTDLIWYSLKSAGFDLKSLIDKDIKNDTDKHIYGLKNPDSNIDFRRVSNQEIFFQRYAKSLNTDYSDIGSFMPGDILVFDNQDHIAMVSDKFNKNGVPYLIQNRDETQKEKEEDRLEITDMKVTGHYRFIYNDKLLNLIKE